MQLNKNEFNTAEHAMLNFCKFLSREHNYLVSKESALRLLYGSDRVLNCLEIDAYGINFWDWQGIINEFCCRSASGFKRVRETKQKSVYTIMFGSNFGVQVTAKIVSGNLDFDRVANVNGVFTYKMSEIAEWKINKYLRSGRMRDMEDLLFISNNYWYHVPHGLRGKVERIVKEWVTNPEYCKQLINSGDPSIDKISFMDALYSLREDLGL